MVRIRDDTDFDKSINFLIFFLEYNICEHDCVGSIPLTLIDVRFRSHPNLGHTNLHSFFEW